MQLADNGGLEPKLFRALLFSEDKSRVTVVGVPTTKGLANLA
jgi:hypothetical protein